MSRFRQSKRKSREWIKGPLRDWIVPYRCNGWFQIAHLLLILVAISICVPWKTRSYDALIITVFMLPMSVAMLGGTEFGRGTVRAYRRTREIIVKRGGLAQDVQIVFAKQLYCVRVGVRRAAYDHGLSHELIPGLATRWKPF
jgi:hypothetical protein